MTKVKIDIFKGIFEFEGTSQELENLLPIFHEIGKIVGNGSHFDKEDFSKINNLQQDANKSIHASNINKNTPAIRRNLEENQYMLLLEELVLTLNAEDTEEIKVLLLFYFFKKIYPQDICTYHMLKNLAHKVNLDYSPSEEQYTYHLKKGWLKNDGKGNLEVSEKGKQYFESILESDLKACRDNLKSQYPDLALPF